MQAWVEVWISAPAGLGSWQRKDGWEDKIVIFRLAYALSNIHGVMQEQQSHVIILLIYIASLWELV